MPSTIRSQLITDQLFTLLDTLSGVEVYRSEVVDQPPTLSNDTRVAPYVVLYPFPGKQGLAGDLAGTSVDADYGCQITCAAGYSADCENLVDRVHPLVYRWSPTLDGVAFGQMKPPPGYDPGPVRIDRTIAPPRFSVPLQYRLVATAN